MTLVEHEQRVLRPSRSRSRSAAIPTWRPSTCRTASTRRWAACRPEVRTNGISVTKNTAGFLGAIGFYSRRQPLRLAVHQQLRGPVRPRRAQARAGRRQRHHLRRAQVRDAALARSRQAGRPRHHGRRRRRRAPRAERAGRGRQRRRRAGAPPTRCTSSASARPAGWSRSREFEDIVVKAGKDGALVRVKDVGRVELGAENYSSRLRFAGVEAAGVGIQLLPSANAIEAFDGVQEELERLRAELPARPRSAQIAFDNVAVVRESIVEVLMTLAEAIGLVVLVMFLFLQNWRSTIIPGDHDSRVAHRHVRVHQALRLLDQHADALRHRARHRHRRGRRDCRDREHRAAHARVRQDGARQAAIDAMAEVFSAVVVIGIVLVAVFVPVAFFPGTTGRMYQQFSLTIAFAVVLSVFNAVTFTPALAALLLDKESHAHGRFFTGVNRVIDGGTNLYVRDRAVGAARGTRRCCCVFAGGAGRRPGAIYRAVPSSFVPDEDEGYFITIVQAPAGASLEYTTNIVKQAERSSWRSPKCWRCSPWPASASAARRPTGADVRAAEGVRGAGRRRAFARRAVLGRAARPAARRHHRARS